jgi:hypothetical protein
MVITDQYIGVTTPATTGLAGITATIATTGTSIAATVIGDEDLMFFSVDELSRR